MHLQPIFHLNCEFGASRRELEVLQYLYLSDDHLVVDDELVIAVLGSHARAETMRKGKNATFKTVFAISQRKGLRALLLHFEVSAKGRDGLDILASTSTGIGVHGEADEAPLYLHQVDFRDGHAS